MRPYDLMVFFVLITLLIVATVHQGRIDALTKRVHVLEMQNAIWVSK